jgi:NADPH2 dehydrogenase
VLIPGVFPSQPDLPLRLKKNLPLTPYDRRKFYNAEQASGYIDYPYAPENEEELGKIVVEVASKM